MCLITTYAFIIYLFLPVTIQEGYTPLLSACENGLSDVAQLLVYKGASIDVTDNVSYIYLCLNIYI